MVHLAIGERLDEHDWVRIVGGVRGECARPRLIQVVHEVDCAQVSAPRMNCTAGLAHASRMGHPTTSLCITMSVITTCTRRAHPGPG
jgi:hypothetical protein